MGSISYNTFINCEGDKKDKKIACLCTRLIDDIVFGKNELEECPLAESPIYRAIE
jgi:hypothetical protein